MLNESSTKPMTIVLILLPRCTEARAEIVGPPIRYLTPGSTLKLTCRITQNTEASAFIFWYHDNRMINYDGDRGINVSTEAGKHFNYFLPDHTVDKGWRALAHCHTTLDSFSVSQMEIFERD